MSNTTLALTIVGATCFVLLLPFILLYRNGPPKDYSMELHLLEMKRIDLQRKFEIARLKHEWEQRSAIRMPEVKIDEQGQSYIEEDV